MSDDNVASLEHSVNHDQTIDESSSVHETSRELEDMLNNMVTKIEKAETELDSTSMFYYKKKKKKGKAVS